jgi:Fic family protein
MMTHPTTAAGTDTTPDALRLGGLAQRIRAEFLEMPGLTLTVPQAARLWNLNVTQSQRLLSELVGAGFLVQDSKGAYRRRGCPRCS